jgi:hypothetical protein
MVPCMVGWNEQWKANVPFVANVTGVELPGASVPASNCPGVSDVAVCDWVPWFSNVTVAPADTVKDAGPNEKSLIVTVLPLPELLAGAPFVDPPPHAVMVTTRTSEQAAETTRCLVPNT